MIYKMGDLFYPTPPNEDKNSYLKSSYEILQ
jgi:hypothetical protein